MDPSTLPSIFHLRLLWDFLDAITVVPEGPRRTRRFKGWLVNYGTECMWVIGTVLHRVESCWRNSKIAGTAAPCISLFSLFGSHQRKFSVQNFRVTDIQQLFNHHSSYTTHHTPLIIHHSSNHHSSYTTHHTPVIKPPLIIHHSSCTTHHAPLIIHHSSYTTHHTPLIIHHSSCTTHHAPLISSS